MRPRGAYPHPDDDPKEKRCHSASRRCPTHYDALEPTIDAKTMEIHHGKHHQAYVDNLNKALEGTPWADQAVEDVIQNLDAIPEDKRAAVRNNGGGHANHSLFWRSCSRRAAAIRRATSRRRSTRRSATPDALKAELNDAGVKRFGSGWTWLVGRRRQPRRSMSTPNQDSPLMEGKTPLLGIDVWEHAYYLKYQNRRPDYLAVVVGRRELGRGRRAASTRRRLARAR